jgi:hypothetical protein
VIKIRSRLLSYLEHEKLSPDLGMYLVDSSSSSFSSSSSSTSSSTFTCGYYTTFLKVENLTS